MRALIIGFGAIGRRHAANLCAFGKRIDVVLLRREGRVDAKTRHLGAHVVPDLGAALRIRPDFAVVATPSAKHIDSLLPLLNAGIPCYVEKPVVTRREDLKRLEETLVGLGTIPVTHAGCNLRYMPSLLQLRRLISDGVIGNVVRASLQAGHWLPDWRPSQDYRNSYSASDSEGGGVILDLIHEIDAARWMFGKIDRVVGIAGKLSSLNITSEDTACLIFSKSTGGPLVAVSLDYVSRRRVRRYEVVGEEGTVIWDLATERLEIVTNSTVRTIECAKDGFDMNKTYAAAMEEFVESVEHGRATSQDIVEGIRSVDLALRAREVSRV